MRILVAYYSRTGVTRRAAQAIGEALRDMAPSVQVQLEELLERKNRLGLLGGLRAGKDAVRRVPAELEPLEADVASFDAVVLGTPVWAFTMTPAARAFLTQHSDMKRLALFCTMGGSGGDRTLEAMAELAGKQPVATLTLIDKHVKRQDPKQFTGKLRQFAETILASMRGTGS